MVAMVAVISAGCGGTRSSGGTSAAGPAGTTRTASTPTPPAARFSTTFSSALDGDFQSADSGGVDPDPRVTLHDLREDVVTVRAAENDAGATVEVNGPDRPGCTTAGTGPNRGRHLDCEHLL